MMKYLPIDQRIALTGVTLAFTSFRPGPVAGNKPVEQVSAIDFQLPPRVKSDERTGEWTAMSPDGGKANAPGLEEPIYTYQGGGPRKLTLEWDYVIDGDRWTITHIKRQASLLRRYAAVAIAQGGADLISSYRRLVILVQLYAVGGEQAMTYRSDGVRFIYSPTLIRDAGSGLVHPLKTTVSMTLFSWPKTKDVDLPQSLLPTFDDWY
jgi:hypothetical protein